MAATPRGPARAQPTQLVPPLVLVLPIKGTKDNVQLAGALLDVVLSVLDGRQWPRLDPQCGCHISHFVSPFSHSLMLPKCLDF